MVPFVREMHPVFSVTLSTLYHIYMCEMTAAWKVSSFFKFILIAFQFQGQLTKKEDEMHEI